MAKKKSGKKFYSTGPWSYNFMYYGNCTCTCIWYAHCKICAHMYIVYSHFSETLTKTLTKFKRVIKSQFPE